MTRTLVAVTAALFFANCAAMHRVTGDPLFAPEEKPVAKGPNVPDAEPTDDLLEQPPERREPQEDELAPLPAPMSKKKGSKVATAAGATR